MKCSHQSSFDRVNNVIKSLKEIGDSLLQAIRKYVSANNKVDAEKFSPFIKKYLKTAVVAYILFQTKGRRDFRSFKLASSSSTEKQSSTLSIVALIFEEQNK